MHTTEEFQKIGEVEEGNLVEQFPHTNIVMSFTSGSIFINGKRNIGYLELRTNDMYAESLGETRGHIGMLENGFRKMNEPYWRENIQADMSSGSLYLIYSKIIDKREVITMPGAHITSGQGGARLPVFSQQNN